MTIELWHQNDTDYVSTRHRQREEHDQRLSCPNFRADRAKTIVTLRAPRAQVRDEPHLTAVYRFAPNFTPKLGGAWKDLFKGFSLMYAKWGKSGGISFCHSAGQEDPIMYHHYPPPDLLPTEEPSHSSTRTQHYTAQPT